MEMPELADVTDDALVEKIVKAQDDRLFYLSEAIRRGYTIEELSELTRLISSSLTNCSISLNWNKNWLLT